MGFKTDVFFATNVTSEETFAVVTLDDIVIGLIGSLLWMWFDK